MILIGMLFLLDHLNVIHVDAFWKYWPLLLIALGLAKFVNEGKRVGGVMLILVGAFFMLENLGFRMLTWATLWPVLIIAAGVAMIWGRFDMPQMRPGTPGAVDARETVTASALFGGVERRITTNNFRQGNASAIMGGIELDFRSAEIEGEEAVLYVEAIFGGIELTVPDHWQVIYEGESMFAGYSDETRAPVVDAMGTRPKKFLIVRGRAIFGGISVKN
jgi:predicted membrane protein